jgi:oxygen-independent coproporphyrinogen III oxidase
VVQHHWGGGTPTHLAPEQIVRLHGALEDAFPTAPGAEVSIEVDPRVTSEEHVDALRACGFTRLSMGVQDFDPRVQAAIHRVQGVEATAALAERARRAGFASVGFDLIYGLPFQSVASMERTLDHVLAIAPDGRGRGVGGLLLRFTRRALCLRWRAEAYPRAAFEALRRSPPTPRS